MNFDLTEEQQMLKDGAARYFAKSYPFEHLRQLAGAEGFSRATWREFAEMGWLGVAVPEEQGGLGLTSVETCLIAEEAGRALVLEPFVTSGVLAAGVVRNVASAAQQQLLLPALAAGQLLVAVAHSEAAARGRVTHVAARAQRSGAGWRLSGRKTLVMAAPVADRFVVVARTDGAVGDEAGLSCFLLPAGAAGLRLEACRLLNGAPAGELVLEGVEVGAEALLGEAGQASAGLQLAVDEAIVAQCAEIVGGLEDVLALCSEYLKTRRQFGVPIGSFQALQHRMADMAIETMQARASLHRGLAALAEPERADRSVTISGCKAQVMRSAKFVTAQGIQLHGGYGITEEYRVGHHYRKLVQADAVFGNMEHHLRRYARHLQQPLER